VEVFLHDNEETFARDTSVKRSASQPRSHELVDGLPPKLEPTEACRTDIEPRLSNAHLTPLMSNEDMLSDLLSELTHYKFRCQKAEERYERKESELRQMESSGPGLAEDLCIKTKRISTLEKRLSIRTDLERWLAVDKLPSVGSNAQQLQTKLFHLKSQLPTVLVMDGNQCPDIDRLFGKCPDLDDLMCTIFTIDVKHPSSERPVLPRGLTLYELIQALVGAAIYRWVFTAEFRWLSMTVTPLLQKYRDYIASLCRY
jgi:hypothetical protein